MTPIIANSMGDVRRSFNKPVADGQDIKKGDLITVASGLVSKADAGAAKIDGVATHPVKADSGYASNAQRPRCIYDVAEPKEQFKGSLKNAQETPTDTSLEGTTAGFIVEDGEYRIDPGAGTKSIVIEKVAEPFTNRNVYCRFLAANTNH